MKLDQLLEDGFVRVTEQAAVAAAHTVGLGDRKKSDQVAVSAMRNELNTLAMAGRIVIGEGERDEAPMLYVGEEVGALKGRPDGVGVDIAVDPLEGTNLCATGAPDATAVLAAAERGGLLHAPDVYMQKLIVGPTAKGKRARRRAGRREPARARQGLRPRRRGPDHRRPRPSAPRPADRATSAAPAPASG